MNNDTKKRTIMIFPEFDNINIIDGIRDRYDPLSKNVRPHITLAFTFDSELSSEELRDHIESVTSQIKPFEITMKDIVKIDNSLGKYMFLLMDEGENEVKKLSSKLYEGIMESYKPQWLNDETYLPHMTVGCFDTSEELDKAYSDIGGNPGVFKTLVNTVSVEIIDENEDSIIDVEVLLNNK